VISKILRLVVLATPLWMASTTKKKKTAAKKIKRTSKRPAQRATSRKSAPRAGDKKNVKAPLKKQARAAPKPPPPAPKIEEEEPFVPPVAPIGRAILLVPEPKEGSSVESLHPTFRWLSVGSATRYEVQWGEDATLATKYASISLSTEATVPLEKPLSVGSIYYWRVRGGNDGGWGPWSPTASFRVLEETP
jgi:hypothetical protein